MPHNTYPMASREDSVWLVLTKFSTLSIASEALSAPAMPSHFAVSLLMSTPSVSVKKSRVIC